MGYPVPPVAHSVSLLLLILSLLAFAPGCNRSQAEGPSPAAKPGASAAPGGPSAVRAIPVTTARAETRAVQRAVETNGSLLAADEVQAKSEQPGTLARLYADLGDRVAAGAPLVEYDRREFQLAVDQSQADLGAAREGLLRARATVTAAEAQVRRARDARPMLESDVARGESQLEWARLELERARQLHAKDLIAARDVDNARNQHTIAATQLDAIRIALARHPDEVRVAEAQLNSEMAAVKSAEAQVRQREATLGIAQKRFGDTIVRAPITGLVARRHVSAGEFVKENTTLFTLVVANPLKYVGTIPERQAPELRPGQTVRLHVEAYPERAFTGTVVRVSPAVEVATRTLALEARVPNPDGTLRPGFFARGAVLTRQDPAAVFVPGEAVMSIAGVTKVFVVADGRAQERAVRPALRQGTLVEIMEGVKAGEVVATSNLPSLFNGAPVTVAPAR